MITIFPKETDDAGTLTKPTNAEFENRQLSLFQNLLYNTDGERERLSHAIELWDSTPRYSFNRKAMNKARVNGQFLEPRKFFSIQGLLYTLTAAPARLRRPRWCFPRLLPRRNRGACGGGAT